jgi:hypothetical protein
MTEHATATEKAGMKTIGLITDCTRSHAMVMYDKAIMNASTQILALIPPSLDVGAP